MRSFFNMDGPIFVFLSKMADFMILNLLFIVCCLPIVTIGAAVTAMSYVCMKMKEGTEGYIWKSFVTSFRMNFKQATGIWLILAVFLAILVTDLLAVRTLPGTFQLPMQIAVMAGLVLWTMIFLTVFTLQSRFYNPVKTTLHNALLLSVANTPRLLLVIVVIAGAVVLTMWNATTIGWGILIWMMFGFALLCYFNIMMLYPSIKKLMPPEEEEEFKPDEAFVFGGESGSALFTENAGDAAAVGDAAAAGNTADAYGTNRPWFVNGKPVESGTSDNETVEYGAADSIPGDDLH